MSVTDKVKIGEGAYGIVYKGKIENKHGIIKDVAVKRNWGDKVSMGTSMVREMSFLKTIKHPSVVRCSKVSKDNPFSETNPLTPRYKGKEMKEDEYLFVMDFIQSDLEKYYFQTSDLDSLKKVMMDILLGVEYIHSIGAMHRDLKPKNILIDVDSDGKPTAKICDFGLSSFATHYRPATPGVVTSSYRAPEICCSYDDYSFPIDVWSVGCIFYEMITRKPLVVHERDTNISIFKTIIRKIPEKMTCEYITEFIKKGDIKLFNHGYSEIIDDDKSDFKTRIIARVDGKIFKKANTTIDEFCDLLNKLLYLDPKRRLTCTEALQHPIFNYNKSEIKQIREQYPPIPLPDPELHIIDCIERRWAVNIAFRIFNERDSDKVEWYNHSIIFHSLRLFDEYLYFTYEKNKKRDTSTTTMGKLHTKVKVHLFYFTCIYMSYKYFTTLYKVFSWKEIFPKSIVQNNSNLDKIVNFENFMLKYICKYVFFRPTMIEYLDQDLFKNNEQEESITEDEKDLDIKIFLYNYGNIDMDYDGTTRDLYEQIKKKREKREKREKGEKRN